jgi:3-dehydroquinate synthase
MAGLAEQIVSVTLRERSYDIALHPGLLSTVGDRLNALTTSPKIGVVTDRHVASHYLQETLRSLCKAGYDPTPIILVPGEQTKTLGTVAKVLDTLAKHKFERQSLLAELLVISPVLLQRSINEESRSYKCRRRLWLK